MLADKIICTLKDFSVFVITTVVQCNCSRVGWMMKAKNKFLPIYFFSVYLCFIIKTVKANIHYRRKHRYIHTLVVIYYQFMWISYFKDHFVIELHPIRKGGISFIIQRDWQYQMISTCFSCLSVDLNIEICHLWDFVML